jgi:hypothetical protein
MKGLCSFIVKNREKVPLNFEKIKGKTIMALEDEKHIKAYSQNFTTMTPGSFQKKLRVCILYQIYRFIAINIKMMIVVGKSH